ncbi:MAG: ubiquitin-like domain-containing protein [bacterium]|jgi:uncharacterized protein YabE (DUF348 family)
MSFRNQRTGFVCIAFLVAVLLLTGVAWARKTVVVTVQGQEKQVVTYAYNVAAVLEQQGITLNEGDIVAPEPGVRATEGMRITVVRAVRAQVLADGAVRDIRTAQPTVGAALQETGIELGELDRCEPSLTAAVVPGMTIRVVRVAEKTEVVQETLPVPVERKNDSSLAYGTTKVLQEGQPGLTEVVYRRVYEDSAATESEVISRTVIQAAIPRVVAVGTQRTVSRGGETFRYDKVLEVTATAYYPDPSWSTGYTYLGMPAERGIIAVDPDVIPLRSKVYVEGYGFAVAGDIGGAIKGNRIDICVDTEAEAVNWGMRKVKVYLVSD